MSCCPFEDDDISVVVSTDPSFTETGYGYDLARVKQRQIVSWFWQKRPGVPLGYQYNQ